MAQQGYQPLGTGEAMSLPKDMTSELTKPGVVALMQDRVKYSKYPADEKPVAFATQAGHDQVLNWVLAALRTPGLIVTQWTETKPKDGVFTQFLTAMKFEVPSPIGDAGPEPVKQ